MTSALTSALTAAYPGGVSNRVTESTITVFALQACDLRKRVTRTGGGEVRAECKLGFATVLAGLPAR